ncbi:MAG: hypothetical protein M3Q46_07165 [Verrucomicrobiota bacterium]|nr:hypothetical protein [Verrucomicrobiota bacterium]
MKTKLLVLLSCVLALHAQAGSATWNLNPASSEWNKAGNWTPATVPNSPDDVATFDVSNVTSLTLSNAEVDSVVFNSGASAYTIRSTTGINGSELSLKGAGIINNSGIGQNFEVSGSPAGRINFYGSATAGESTVFMVEGGKSSPSLTFYDTSSAGSGTFISQAGPDNQHPDPGQISFSGDSTAANGTFICNGAEDRSAYPGAVYFSYNATAGQGTFIAHGGSKVGVSGGDVALFHSSNAGEATFTAEGSDIERLGGAVIRFYHDASAADATLIATGGLLDGGRIAFEFGEATGGRARVELFGNGRLEIFYNNTPVTIGSLEGDGLVMLGTGSLGIGSNDLSTTFAGVISGSGSLTKVGAGHLTLNNASIYSGATTVVGGGLRVSNSTGSATGTGAVQVSEGILGGRGIIAGAVTIGTGSGVGASIALGIGASAPTVMTIQSSLTLKADGTYACKLNTKKARADQVAANGVTLESGAQFNLAAVANRKLTAGTSFTVISNTAATPISGTFANLPNDSTLTVGPNTFQISYSGGDGNDLTLTVVP